MGTGNGALLFKLSKKGIYRKLPNTFLKGVDYSDESIKLSKYIQSEYCADEDQSEERREDFKKI